MKNVTFQQVQPLAGTHVAAYCAGMRRAPFDTEGNEGLISDYGDGAAAGRKMPPRLAKRRATRIAHEHRRSLMRRGSRGNMAAAMAQPTNTPGFVRFAEARS